MAPARAVALEIVPDAVEPDLLEALHVSLQRPGAHQTPALIGPDGATTELPYELFEFVVAVVEMLKDGNAVAVAPMYAELTTVQAADQLNISRPFLIKELKAGKLPYHMVGTHRRVLLSDVLAYREAQKAASREALAEMTREAEAAGLYDE